MSPGRGIGRLLLVLRFVTNAAGLFFKLSCCPGWGGGGGGGGFSPVERPDIVTRARLRLIAAYVSVASITAISLCLLRRLSWSSVARAALAGAGGSGVAIARLTWGNLLPYPKKKNKH